MGLRLTGRNRSIWKSQASERRLREPTGGRRERMEAASSSAPPPPALPPPRMNLAAEGPAEEIPGLARRILGAGEGELPEDDEEPAEPEEAIGFLCGVCL